jgi:lipopolysaccharide export system protein LptA
MKIFLAWSAALLLWLPTASSQVPEEGRTTIDSDTLEMQGTIDHNFFYFGGNVRVRGTDLEISCDELTVQAARDAEERDTVGRIGAVEKIIAVGRVVIQQAGREARAGRVEVDPVAGTIRFMEQPVILQGDVRATAYEFLFHTTDKRLEAVNPPGFQPGQKEGRSSITLSGLPVITPEVPVDALTVPERVARDADEAAPETPAEPVDAADEETPAPPATEAPPP